MAKSGHALKKESCDGERMIFMIEISNSSTLVLSKRLPVPIHHMQLYDQLTIAQ